MESAKEKKKKKASKKTARPEDSEKENRPTTAPARKRVKTKAMKDLQASPGGDCAGADSDDEGLSDGPVPLRLHAREATDEVPADVRSKAGRRQAPIPLRYRDDQSDQ